MNSDLAPLADLGFVESVEGGYASIKGTISSGDTGISLHFAGPMAASKLTAYGASMERLDWQGGFTAGTERFSGEGAWKADTVSYSTWKMGDVKAQVAAAAQQLKFQNMEATFLDGKIRAHGQLHPFDPKAPGSLDVSLEALDLEAFSHGLDVEDVQLTGIARGAGYVAWDLDGLQDMQLMIEAPEGLTIGRALLEQLLLSETLTSGLTASTVRIIREEVLGEKEAKAFDSARLDLHYRDGHFLGPLELRSSNLNLTIDLDVEERALADALALGSEAAGGDLSITLQ
jgi:hypothetical protein